MNLHIKSLVVVLLLLTVVAIVSVLSSPTANEERAVHYEERHDHGDEDNIVEDKRFHHQDRNNNNNNGDNDQEKEDRLYSKWLNSETISHFIGMTTTKELIIDIPVNFIFIGFSGEGNLGFDLASDTLTEWFEHLEHSLPHIIVPFGEDYTTNERYETPKTHIQYRFNIHVSKVNQLVNTLIEDAIYWNMRPEEAEYQDRFYTNPNLVTSLLSSLSMHLGLGEKSYTLYILNPNNPLPEYALYGYRTGFANEELEELYRAGQTGPKIVHDVYGNNGYQFAFERIDKNEEPGEIVKINTTSTTGTTTATGSKTSSIWYRDVGLQSKEWAEQISSKFNRYRNKSDSLSAPLYNFDCEDHESDQQCKERLRKKTPINNAKVLLQDGSPEEKYYVINSQQYHLSENCLVDSWISEKRFTFIDLTAGPFEWGPAIGGTGLKSNISLPKIPKINLSTDFKRQQKEQSITLEDVTQKIASELTLIDTLLEINCMNGLHDEQDPNTMTDDQEFSCQNLLKSKYELNQILQEKKTDDIDSLLDKIDEVDFLLGNYYEYFEDNEQNKFKAHLSSVLSDSIRYLIAQPQPLFSVKYSNRVNFHVLIISDHKNYNPRDSFNFNYDLFKEEISKLKTTSQEFSFTISTISMEEEPSLALAYQSSLRTVLLPSITDDGKFETKLHYYIDSKEIKYQLNRLDPDKHDSEGIMESKHIPIFIFSLDSKHPVFIDKNLQAKTLNNMVIGVQTNIVGYESSTFSCNGKKTKLYLNNPLTPILAATATALGGLVPQYISYSQAQQTTIQNWQWAVGNSPFSKTFTYPFSHFSQYQKDSIHRNYIMSSLERSITKTNYAISLLNIKPSIKSYSLFIEQYPYIELLAQFMEIKNQWRESLKSIEEFNYSKGIKFAIDAEKNSHLLLQKVELIETSINISMCKPKASIKGGGFLCEKSESSFFDGETCDFYTK
ncbi:hypothetical protein DFA_08855 [Cavenderia fasciculata]|uniref:DUF7906 domain-containing protein n=1 Tax=Cavenderia fasciculata TaxID=261658 RepID=F4Q4Q8_CACFS|nr:uncharacterized protein DFA_08855 [Cavenderia fasciculata]EGG17854.1 hypothetical protein DFA_08855 [Cavenderia fasciculata]|eukprot:XP_004356338.1 hypothetical protein DFA_08855 [Cavenderia fasciculata]